MFSLATQKDDLNIFDEDEEDIIINDAENPTGGSPQRQTINVDEEIAFAFDAAHSDLSFDPNYGLLAPEQTVVCRAYSDDSDDKALEEINPRFIVMYEPNPEFIRRIEVCKLILTNTVGTKHRRMSKCYRSSNPGLSVRVYLMIYRYSCEEHKFLAGIRREKEAFVRLIKERSVSMQ